MLRRRTNLALATCACSGPSGAARPFKTGMPNATRDSSGPIIDRGVRLPPHATIPARIDATPPCIVLPSDRKFGASVPWTTAPSANRATCWMTGIAQLTGLRPSAGISTLRRFETSLNRLKCANSGRSRPLKSTSNRRPAHGLRWLPLAGSRSKVDARPELFLCYSAMTREARRGRNPQASSDSGVGRRRL